MVKFCKHVTDYVRKVESNAIQYLNYLETIEDLVQLANLRLEPDDLLQ